MSSFSMIISELPSPPILLLALNVLYLEVLRSRIFSPRASCADFLAGRS